MKLKARRQIMVYNRCTGETIIRGNLTWYGGMAAHLWHTCFQGRGRRGFSWHFQSWKSFSSRIYQQKHYLAFRTLIKSKLGNLFHIFSPLAQYSHWNHYTLSGPTNDFTGTSYTLASKFHGELLPRYTLHVSICLSEINTSTVTKPGLGTLTSHIPAPFKNWISSHTNPKDTYRQSTCFMLPLHLRLAVSYLSLTSQFVQIIPPPKGQPGSLPPHSNNKLDHATLLCNPRVPCPNLYQN